VFSIRKNTPPGDEGNLIVSELTSVIDWIIPAAVRSTASPINKLYSGRQYQWEFQDPKMEVLYHIFGHTLWGYPLT